MTPTRSGIIGCLALFVGFAPESSGAQLANRVVLTPYVGFYTPTNDVAAVSTNVAGVAVSGSAKHRSSPAFGMNLSYWLSERTAIEFGGLYVQSDLRGTINASQGGVNVGESIDDNARLWVASAKYLMHLMPPESKFSLRLGLGPAVINRGGSAYKDEDGQEITGLTSFGAAMSLCTRFGMSNGLGLRLRAENFMYPTRITIKDVEPGADLKFDRKLQNDLVFSVGLQYFLNR